MDSQTRSKPYTIKHFFVTASLSLLVAALILAISAFSLPGVAGTADCDIPDSCDAYSGLPSADVCLETGGCECAIQIDCYLQTEAPDDWPVVIFPEQQVNVAAPHGRWFTLKTNLTSAQIDDLLDQENVDKEVSLPAGSLFYMQEYGPGDEAGEVGDLFSYHLVYKPADDFCTDENTPLEDGDCIGGNWFWLSKLFTSTAIAADRIDDAGQPQPCVGCHGFAVEQDWLFSLFLKRRFPDLNQ